RAARAVRVGLGPLRPPLPVAFHHAPLEPDPLHRALLSLPRARGPGAAALHRGDVGRVLDPPGPRLPALPRGRDDDGRAGGVRSGVARPVRVDRGPLGSPRRRPPQVPRDRRPHRCFLAALRLEAEPVSIVRARKVKEIYPGLSTYYRLSR